MIIVVTCNQCGHSGAFSVRLSFVYNMESCRTCHNFREHDWSFNFCNHDCFMKWMREWNVEKEGIPCQSCKELETGRPSGFAFGFKENGACTVCKGTGRVR